MYKSREDLFNKNHCDYFSGVNRTKLHDMIADLGDEELSRIPPGMLSPARSPTRITDHEGGRAEEGTNLSGTE